MKSSGEKKIQSIFLNNHSLVITNKPHKNNYRYFSIGNWNGNVSNGNLGLNLFSLFYFGFDHIDVTAL